MDQEEKELLEEANTMRAIELHCREKRNEALLAIGMVLVVTTGCVVTVWWALRVLAQPDVPWFPGIGLASLISLVALSLATFFAAMKRKRVWKTYAALLVFSVFLAGFFLAN